MSRMLIPKALSVLAAPVMNRSRRDRHLPPFAKLVGERVQPFVRALAHLLAFHLLECMDTREYLGWGVFALMAR